MEASSFDELIDELQKRHAKITKVADKLPEKYAAEANIRAVRARGENALADQLFISYLSDFFEPERLNQAMVDAEASGEDEKADIYREAIARQK